MGARVVHVIDAESGNLCSLENALKRLGYSVKWVKSADYDWNSIHRLIFPGVGNFGHFMNGVFSAGLDKPVREYIESGKPFMGICVGLQALFSGSTESPGVKGLGLIHDTLDEFDKSSKSVPQIGWNSAVYDKDPSLSIYGLRPTSKYYYVHSYRASTKIARDAGWTIVKANYMGEEFIGALAKDNIFATQFHPEKSGVAGLRVIKAFLDGVNIEKLSSKYSELDDSWKKGQLTKRLIACLDVRSNDEGDLVVTKGDQYDVREKSESGKSNVRNLGKPVDLARRYYEEGADEITFLNITSFRDCPLKDAPMLEVLRRTAETVFVPLTIGGGIRDTVDPDGTFIPALDVAVLYFRSGADKVSIGSDAVLAAEEYYANGCKLSGKSPMETISHAYGAQAVVVSVDPKRVYVSVEEDTPHHTIKTAFPDEHGRSHVWYQCTIKGGRETRDLDVWQLVKAVEAMGAGEILLNCIDKDGSNSGFDLELIQDVKNAVSIPVIASSGAGNPQHFLDVFEKTTTDAALGAGMFHRGEYTVHDVKEYLSDHGLLVRNDPDIHL